MSDDPIKAIRTELLRAARRRTTHPRRRAASTTGRTLAIIGAGLVIGVPAIGAATGVITLGTGHTPGGGSFTIQQRTIATPGPVGALKPDESGNVCEKITINVRGRRVATVSACAKATADPGDPLRTGFVIAPGHSTIVTGTVNATVADITITGIKSRLALKPITGERRRAFSAATQATHVTVTAYNRHGTKLKATHFEHG